MAKRSKSGKLKSLQRELTEAKRLYEAAKSSQYHRLVASSRSPDGVMDAARGKIRDWARYLDENHDLAIGILDELVNKIIGTGLVVEPMVRNRDGTLAQETNAALRRMWDRWQRRTNAPKEGWE